MVECEPNLDSRAIETRETSVRDCLAPARAALVEAFEIKRDKIDRHRPHTESDQDLHDLLHAILVDTLDEAQHVKIQVESSSPYFRQAAEIEFDYDYWGREFEMLIRNQDKSVTRMPIIYTRNGNSQQHANFVIERDGILSRAKTFEIRDVISMLLDGNVKQRRVTKVTRPNPSNIDAP